jgi:hypothetical protein
MGDMCTCVGPPDTIILGSMGVFIGGKPAARMGDQCAHGGRIVAGCPTVLIGDTAPGSPPSPVLPLPVKMAIAAMNSISASQAASQVVTMKAAAKNGIPFCAKCSATNTGTTQNNLANDKDDNISRAIDIIRNSKFAKTEEGQKVLKRIEEINNSGRIKFEEYKEENGLIKRGTYNPKKQKIGINIKRKNDPDFIASELVHEATHSIWRDKDARIKVTIDEEMKTNENQLALYEEQREKGYKDFSLEDRRDDFKEGKLRDNVRRRYPGIPENLS